MNYETPEPAEPPSMYLALGAEDRTSFLDLHIDIHHGKRTTQGILTGSNRCHGEYTDVMEPGLFEAIRNPEDEENLGFASQLVVIRALASYISILVGSRPAESCLTHEALHHFSNHELVRELMGRGVFGERTLIDPETQLRYSVIFSDPKDAKPAETLNAVAKQQSLADVSGNPTLIVMMPKGHDVRTIKSINVEWTDEGGKHSEEFSVGEFDPAPLPEPTVYHSAKEMFEAIFPEEVTKGDLELVEAEPVDTVIHEGEMILPQSSLAEAIKHVQSYKDKELAEEKYAVTQRVLGDPVPHPQNEMEAYAHQMRGIQRRKTTAVPVPDDGTAIPAVPNRMR